MENTNNAVKLQGWIDSPMTFSHEIFGEGFYTFTLKVPRLSDVADYLPVIISERLLTNLNLDVSTLVEINGQFRSYNNFDGEGSKLRLNVFARDIEVLPDDADLSNPNIIKLNGFICRKPIYRKTPFGREIADILIAVNRSFNKSDYIPSIAWGRNARFCETLEVGTKINVEGRVQSRDYQKKYSEEDIVTKTAYEISISKIELATEKEENTDEQENETSSL